MKFHSVCNLEPFNIIIYSFIEILEKIYYYLQEDSTFLNKLKKSIIQYIIEKNMFSAFKKIYHISTLIQSKQRKKQILF